MSTPLHSMTGFASRHIKSELGSINLDLKSVNSRFFEVYFKLPDELRHLESALRARLQQAVTRGKIECYVTCNSSSAAAINLNEELLKALLEKVEYIRTLAPQAGVSALELLNFPGVICDNSGLSPELDQLILANFDSMLLDFESTRVQEGNNLRQAILERLGRIAQHLDTVGENLAQLTAAERARLKEKLGALALSVDPARMEQEVILYAQKSDIAEEYDRLRSHIQQTRQILERGGVCGKKLDFLMQEFNREANTLASKASNLELTQTAVELKVLIEQLREQVQNLE